MAMATATDYDAPRGTATIETTDDSLQHLKERRRSRRLDVDEVELAAPLDLLGADPSDEPLTITVVPMQVYEFRCGSCFLIHHRRRLADAGDARTLCQDCAG